MDRYRGSGQQVKLNRLRECNTRSLVPVGGVVPTRRWAPVLSKPDAVKGRPHSLRNRPGVLMLSSTRLMGEPPMLVWMRSVVWWFSQGSTPVRFYRLLKVPVSGTSYGHSPAVTGIETSKFPRVPV